MSKGAPATGHAHSPVTPEQRRVAKGSPELPINQILHGDSLSLISTFPDRSIGMVVSDPPFFIGIGRDSGGLGSDPWTRDIGSIESAAAWARGFTSQFARVVRLGGAVVVMAGAHAVAAWMLAAEDAGLVWMAELKVLWNTGKPRARNFGSLHTSILWFTVPGARHSWGADGRRSIYSNILMCRKVPVVHRKHSAQKPVELTNFLVSLLSKQSDVVLDPFCGSGGSLVSAKLCGRNWIGIDKEKSSVTISRRRVEHAEVEEEGELYLWVNGRLEQI